MAPATFLVVRKFRPVGIGDLPGTYGCNFDDGTETLDLGADGSYGQIVSVRNQPQLQRSGRWSYNPATGHLRLENPIMADHTLHGLPPLKEPYTWVLDVGRGLSGKVQFEFDPDMDLSFERADAP